MQEIGKASNMSYGEKIEKKRIFCQAEKARFSALRRKRPSFAAFAANNSSKNANKRLRYKKRKKMIGLQNNKVKQQKTTWITSRPTSFFGFIRSLSPSGCPHPPESALLFPQREIRIFARDRSDKKDGDPPPKRREAPPSFRVQRAQGETLHT